MKVSIKFAQETADMVTFTEEILMENIIFLWNDKMFEWIWSTVQILLIIL